jgi:hypothetical protein
MTNPLSGVELDLTKGEKHFHPDIKTDGTGYMCMIGGRWFYGNFDMQWYGLNFNGWINPYAGLQYDKPGWNASRWERVIEVTIT